jgi:hypothetical protein
LLQIAARLTHMPFEEGPQVQGSSRCAFRKEMAWGAEGGWRLGEVVRGKMEIEERENTEMD